MSLSSVDTRRSCFQSAATALVELVDQIPLDAWDRCALGVWSVRDLVGHTSRALSTVESYLAKTADGDRLDGPVNYFLAIGESLADPDAVAQRGRDAGAALGQDPAAAIHDLVNRVSTLVNETPDDAPVATPVGTMTLANYLPTRTFELAAHGLDLTRALGLRTPSAMSPAISASLELAGTLGGQQSSAPELLLLLTGRDGLSEHLSVL